MGKIVILGAGHVGSSCALSLANLGVGEEIVLVDVVEGKADAQAKDVADATVFMPTAPLVREGAYSDCEDADIVVCAVGVSRKPGQTRLDMLDDTIALIDNVVAELSKTAFGGVFVSISNPCDVVANYLRVKLGYPAERIFGTGTLLDSARLVRAIASRAHVAPRSVQAFAIGEHGDSSQVALSQATILGKRVVELVQEDPDRFGMLTMGLLAERTHQLGMEIVIGKGSTEFGIAAAVADLCRAILRDEHRSFPLSVLLTGEYGVEGVMAGIPAIVGRSGIERTIEHPLTDEEIAGFRSSCEVIRTFNKKAGL